MPVKWTAESDFKVLLYVIKNLDAKVTNTVCDEIATMLGDGTNANAVKFV